LEGVVQAAGPLNGVDGELGDGTTHIPPVQLFGAAVPPDLATPVLFEGRWPARDDEIVLERWLAPSEFTVGGRVAFRPRLRPDAHARCAPSACEADPVYFTVSGLAEMPLMPATSFMSRADIPAFVLPAALDRLATSEVDRFTWIGVRLKESEKISEFRTAVRQALLMNRSGDLLIESAEAIRNSFAAMARGPEVLPHDSVFFGLLGILALIAAGLVIAGSVRGRLSWQPGEIGILKAVGLSPGQLAAALTGRHALLGLIAGLLGWLGAVWFSLGHLPLLTQPLFLIAVLAVVQVIVFLFATVTGRRAGRQPVIAALRNAPVDAPSRASRVGSIAQNLGLPVPLVIAVRQAFAGQRRSLRSVAALALTVATMAVAFGFFSDVEQQLSQIPNPSAYGDLVVHPNGDSLEEVQQLASEQQFVQSAVRISRLTATRPVKAPVGLRVLGDEPPPRAKAMVIKGRFIERPGEALAGTDLDPSRPGAGLDIGEKATVTLRGARTTSGERLPDRQIELTIVGLTNEGPQELTVGSESFGSLREVEVASNSVFVTLREGMDPEAAARALESAGTDIVSNAAVIPGLDDHGFQEILYAMTGILVLVGVWNVVATTAQIVRERSRDIAVIKAVGFTPRQVRTSVIGTAGILACPAVIVGIPLGTAAWQLAWLAMNLDMEREPWARAAWLRPGQAIALFTGALMLVLAGATFPAREASRLRVTPALRPE
jgi:putative ABC transport system permease protein